MSEHSVEKSASYIWWLSEGELEALPTLANPTLDAERRSMLGRPLRGRLWGNASVDEARFKETILGRWLSHCGGIVVCEQDLAALRDLPGTVTDLNLHRVL